MDFLMDDSVVAFYGMVKFLPIMLGKMCPAEPVRMDG